jgi:hypothetical protein
MRTSGQQFGAGFLFGLALCASSACGGAASTPLDQPATTPSGSSSGDMSNHMRDATMGSSSGGGNGNDDATVSDEANQDQDGASIDNSDSGDDAGNPSPDDAGPPDASAMCGACTFGNRCCTVPGAISYGRCYAATCGFCCL